MIDSSSFRNFSWRRRCKWCFTTSSVVLCVRSVVTETFTSGKTMSIFISWLMIVPLVKLYNHFMSITRMHSSKMRTDRCSVHDEMSVPGESLLRGEIPPCERVTNRRLWKHYLPLQSVIIVFARTRGCVARFCWWRASVGVEHCVMIPILGWIKHFSIHRVQKIFLTIRRECLHRILNPFFSGIYIIIIITPVAL